MINLVYMGHPNQIKFHNEFQYGFQITRYGIQKLAWIFHRINPENYMNKMDKIQSNIINSFILLYILLRITVSCIMVWNDPCYVKIRLDEKIKQSVFSSFLFMISSTVAGQCSSKNKGEIMRNS